MPSRAVRSTRKKPTTRLRSKKRGVLGLVGRGIAALAGLAFALVAYSYLTLPDVRRLATANPTTTAFIELRAREAHDKGTPAKRIQHWVPYSRISPSLKRAVLVAEDAKFWDHDGVDYVELQKSLELDWARGQLSRGASTITQQLAKNLYLSPTRNPLRKLRELIIARRLEAELEKARIFEIYLNVIEWGDGIYGADAAARTYFGVPAASLNPTQAALLAGAIINPRLLNPAHPTPRLRRRQQIILSRMGEVTPPTPVKPRPPIETPESPDSLEALPLPDIKVETPPPSSSSSAPPGEEAPPPTAPAEPGPQ